MRRSPTWFGTIICSSKLSLYAPFEFWPRSTLQGLLLPLLQWQMLYTKLKDVDYFSSGHHPMCRLLMPSTTMCLLKWCLSMVSTYILNPRKHHSNSIKPKLRTIRSVLLLHIRHWLTLNDSLAGVLPITYFKRLVQKWYNVMFVNCSWISETCSR